MVFSSMSFVFLVCVDIVGRICRKYLRWFICGLHEKTSKIVMYSAGNKSIGIILGFGARAFKEVIRSSRATERVSSLPPWRIGEKFEIHEIIRVSGTFGFSVWITEK